MRLGVNIDHVATLRNARDEKYPSPVHAALMAEQAGAANVTCHLREDRRHIRDEDVFLIKDTLKVPLNFEFAATKEMHAIAQKLMPEAVTLVPEKREEKTTEGGLDFGVVDHSFKEIACDLVEKGIVVSLFIEPEIKAIDDALSLGVQAVEIHTGKWCHDILKVKSTKEKISLVKELEEVVEYGADKGLQMHVGHGLNYQNAGWLQHIPAIEEANIGHAIIAKSIFVGLGNAVREMHELLNNPAFKH